MHKSVKPLKFLAKGPDQYKRLTELLPGLPPGSPVLRSQTGDLSTSSDNPSQSGSDLGAPRITRKFPRTNASEDDGPLTEENSLASNENEVIPKNLDNEFVEAIKQSNEELRTSIDDSNNELKNILNVNTLSVLLGVIALAFAVVSFLTDVTPEDYIKNNIVLTSAIYLLIVMSLICYSVYYNKNINDKITVLTTMFLISVYSIFYFS